jgi:hypothetical protein
MAKWFVTPRVDRQPASGDLTGIGAIRDGVGPGVCKSNVSLRTMVNGWRAGHQIDRVSIVTWSNTGVVIGENRAWFDSLGSVRVAIRANVAELKPAECKAFVARFGPDALRVSESHAEVVVCEGPEPMVGLGSCGVWDLGPASSGVCEWYLTDTRPEVVAWWLSWFESFPRMPIAGAEPARQRTLAEIMGGWS